MEDIAKVLLGGILALVGSFLAHWFAGSREREKRQFETRFELVKDSILALENYINSLNSMLSALDGVQCKNQSIDMPEVQRFVKEADKQIMVSRSDFRKAQSLTRLVFGEQLDTYYKELSEVENSIRVSVFFENQIPDSEAIKSLVRRLFRAYYKIFDEFQILLWGQKALTNASMKGSSEGVRPPFDSYSKKYKT